MKPTNAQKEKFAQTIRQARIDLNMSQREVEQDIGTSRGRVSEYESMKETPGFQTARQMIKLFGLEPDEIDNMHFYNLDTRQYESPFE